MRARRSQGRHGRHSAEFKRQVLAESAAPGARIAAVAAAHGISPSLIYYWRSRAAASVLRASAIVATAAPTAATTRFVPVAVTDSLPGTIRIEVRRGDTTAQVHWPLTAAGACAEWLRHWLR